MTRGARVDLRELSAGHELAGADVIETSEWDSANSLAELGLNRRGIPTPISGLSAAFTCD
jgi:hypothetical protein